MLQLWRNLVRSDIVKVTLTNTFSLSLSEDVTSVCVCFFSQLQPMVDQRIPDILTLQCPTEVSINAEGQQKQSYKDLQVTWNVNSYSFTHLLILFPIHKDRPFLRTEFNTPSNHHSIADHLIQTVRIIHNQTKWFAKH